MCGSGHIQGNLALRVCEPLCGECAVQRRPQGYQGEGISAARLRAFPPCRFCDTLSPVCSSLRTGLCRMAGRFY